MEFLALGVLLFVGSFISSGLLLVSRASGRADRLHRAWGAYATRHGYRLERETTIERPVQMTGIRGPLHFSLQVLARDEVVTRLSARRARPIAGVVVAAHGSARRREGSEVLPTEDPAFQRLFAVRASDPGEVAAVLGAGVRMSLMRFPMPMVRAGLRFVVDRDEATLEWAGGEVDVVALDAAYAVLVAACREGATGYRTSSA